ncbi:MAG: TauD/TfdA family dioxygenase [Actinomycetota bacterium]
MTAPAPVQDSAATWRADDWIDPSTWSWRLDPAAIDEMAAATERFAGADPQAVGDLGARELRFDAVADRLRALHHTLVHGRGFELVRGLPVRDMSAGQAAAIFVAVGAHLGSARSQNADGHLLGHVRNVGLDVGDPTVRIYQTNRRQTFHTDSTDAVGLLCLEEAAEGGESLLVSAPAIYNVMLDRDPDLAALLFEPVATDRRGEIPPGADPWFPIPVLSWFDERLTVLYQRQYIESAARFADAPPLTDRMVAALDLFDEIANDPTMYIRMRLEVGDMQFVHNHSLLHDRTGFVDKPDAPRHLLRLWLSLPGDRRLPEIFATRYGSTVVGDRGGIVVA